jgi:membrane-associated protease RseP (regulator of RpoE activity)
MTDQLTPDNPGAPERPEGGVATRVATSVSSSGYGVDPDKGGVSYPALRLGLLFAAMALLAYANMWMFIVVMAVVVMIALHELGHYLTAKRAGMKVTEFFVGFGPRIWSTTRGETEYGLKVIPAGAYVKIPGMVNLDEVAPEDEGRTYRQKSFGQRVSVAVAGSAMHFALALVLLYTALVLVGTPGATFGADPAEQSPVVAETYPGSGAAEAGLETDDEIVSVNGTATPTRVELRESVGDARGETVPIEVDRQGEIVATQVTIGAFETPSGQQACGLGIQMSSAPDEKLGPVEGLVAAPKEFVNVAWLSAKGLASFFSPSGIGDFASQVGSADEDANAPPEEETNDGDPCEQTVAGAGSSSGSAEGENRILSIYGLVRLGSDVGGVNPGALIGLFALINIFIGMFNLIPLLPFDGGHVAIACYEKVQEKRLHRRRYFADVSKLLPLTYGVVIVLGLLFFSSLYLDIVNPIGG